MAPLPASRHRLAVRLLVRRSNTFGDWRNVDKPEAYIVEAWGEGFLFGSLLIMAIITIVNMRKGVLLHKLILLELILAMSHGTFAFMAFNGYGWYLSSTAALLYSAYWTHNLVAWLKIAPFFSGPHASFRPRVCRAVRWIYLPTLALSAPVIIFEIFNNFRYFNNISELYKRVRPYEPLMRDPWWLFSCLTLFYVISRCYNIQIWQMTIRAPRFGILLGAIVLAIGFTIMDILASIIPALSQTDGINPYWKLALVFRCLTDNIMLDDFRAVLHRLGAIKLDGTGTMEEVTTDTLPEDDKDGGAPDGEKHGAAQDGGSRRWSRTWARLSLSGRTLDDGEDHDGNAGGTRKHSFAVGKLGVKIDPMPPLPDAGASENLGEGGGYTAEPWEQVDFITSLTEPEDHGRKRRTS